MTNKAAMTEALFKLIKTLIFIFMSALKGYSDLLHRFFQKTKLVIFLRLRFEDISAGLGRFQLG